MVKIHKLITTPTLTIYDIQPTNQKHKEGVKTEIPDNLLECIAILKLSKFHETNPPSPIYYGYIKDNFMENADIAKGDMLVIKKQEGFQHNQLVLCGINGKFTLKRAKQIDEERWLMPEEENSQPIKITKENTSIIWGIVKGQIKSLDKNCH